MTCCEYLLLEDFQLNINLVIDSFKSFVLSSFFMSI